MAFKFIDNQNRKVLGEGRSFGFGGNFAKRTGNTLEMAYPLTACKEYYSEIIISQWTGKSFTAYGLTTSKIEGLFEKDRAYLVCSILEHKNGGKYAQYDRDYKALNDNYKNLQKFINWFEKQLNLKQFTKIRKIEENKYVCICPIFWVKFPYLISLYGLLLRDGIFYTDGNPMEYLKNFKENADDVYALNTVIPKLERMLNGEIPEENLNNIANPHGQGIVTFAFPNIPATK